MIIKNGLVVDPALGLSEKMDLAIENGTILKIKKNILPEYPDHSRPDSGLCNKPVVRRLPAQTGFGFLTDDCGFS